MEVQETRVQTDRVLTIPNILSMARLVGVPLFLWLILRPVFGGPNSDGWALLVLMLSGISDYLDGKLARRWNQISSLSSSWTRPRTACTFCRPSSGSPGGRSSHSGSRPRSSHVS